MESTPMKISSDKEARVTLFVVLTCMVAGSGGLLFGYDLGISGGVTSMDSFLSKFFPEVVANMKKEGHVSNYCKFDSQLLMAFTSSLYIAGFVASLLASQVTNRFGRRSSMLFGAVLFICGAGLSGAGFNLLTVTLGRILFGASIGFTNQSIPLYISEMSPPKYRGAMNGFFEISLSIGLLAANIVNYGTQKIRAGWGWRLSLALAALPASFLLIGLLFLPETPSCIIYRNGDSQEASRILQKIRGTSDVQNELKSVISAAADASQAASDHLLHRLARRQYRPYVVMAVALPAFRQFTGINFITFYAPVMFRIIGFKESASLLAALVTRLTATVCIVLAMGSVDKLGRRKFFFVGGSSIIVALMMVGGVMAMKLGDHGTMRDAYAYLVLCFLCIYVAGFSWSWGLLPWLVASEIFPLEIRSAGQSVFVASDFLFGAVIAQSMLYILCYLKFGVFFLFGGLVVLMSLFVYWLLPETKELPLEQMGRVWEEHWFWKRFVESDEERK
ncbi:hexose carrier protein HEX6-like [Phalaenopsis equestris]|uniref:hexose carrier protein HEX6-like n=1 Tax=Phalaenopsis equestris TaxID=78828 RepID=UPI0009E34CD8|nr:hexose carrier protein HEX6-like [Phalaenopsis equestris]